MCKDIYRLSKCLSMKQSKVLCILKLGSDRICYFIIPLLKATVHTRSRVGKITWCGLKVQKWFPGHMLDNNPTISYSNYLALVHRGYHYFVFLKILVKKLGNLNKYLNTPFCIHLNRKLKWIQFWLKTGNL